MASSELPAPSPAGTKQFHTLQSDFLVGVKVISCISVFFPPKSPLACQGEYSNKLIKPCCVCLHAVTRRLTDLEDVVTMITITITWYDNSTCRYLKCSNRSAKPTLTANSNISVRNRWRKALNNAIDVYHE
jgi:hypothetical protein